MTLNLVPLTALHLSTIQIPSHAKLPNTSPHGHPLYIYEGAYPPTTSPSTLESHLRANNLNPQWRYTMYQTTHYHSTTHEVLCVYSGRAKLLFGGEENPERKEVTVGAGDAIIVPAGVGHRLLQELEEPFSMVGAYPKGCNWDMCYGKAGEEDKEQAVAGVKWLQKDPLYGDDGPALRHLSK